MLAAVIYSSLVHRVVRRGLRKFRKKQRLAGGDGGGVEREYFRRIVKKVPCVHL